MKVTAYVILFVFTHSLAAGFCFEEAGQMYGIAPRLLWSISKGESNFNPQAVGRNKNGTYDYGLMQINTIWEPTLRKHGIAWESLSDPCTNVKVGAWILAGCFKDYGYTWEGVGCYNSRTPSHRNRYANKVARILEETERYLRAASKQEIAVVSSTPWNVIFGDDHQ